MTSMADAVLPEHRGLCPLERAGWQLTGIPLPDYIRRFTQAWKADGPDFFAATEAKPPGNSKTPSAAQPTGPPSPVVCQVAA
jgi:hypothetical protein